MGREERLYEIMAEWHPLRSYNDGADEWNEWNQLNKSAENRGRCLAPAKLPTLRHSSMADYQHVYEPSDDTYLLLDAIKFDLGFSGYPDNDAAGGGDKDDGDEEKYNNSDGKRLENLKKLEKINVVME